MSRSRKPNAADSGRLRRSFSLEFKQEAVRHLAERRAENVNIAQIARELDVRPSLLREWARQLEARELEPRVAPRTADETPEQELRRLRRELEITRQERDFLKKATAYFAKESQ